MIYVFTNCRLHRYYALQAFPCNYIYKPVSLLCIIIYAGVMQSHSTNSASYKLVNLKVMMLLDASQYEMKTNREKTARCSALGVSYPKSRFSQPIFMLKGNNKGTFFTDTNSFTVESTCNGI